MSGHASKRGVERVLVGLAEAIGETVGILERAPARDARDVAPPSEVGHGGQHPHAELQETLVLARHADHPAVRIARAAVAQRRWPRSQRNGASPRGDG